MFTRSRSIITATLSLPLLLAGPPAAAAGAQEPTGRLSFVTCDADARAHLVRALVEIENIGRTRADPHLDAALTTAPDCPFARALHAFAHSELAPDARLRALDAALADAVHGSTTELMAIAAMREMRRPNGPERLPVLQAAEKLAAGEPYFALLVANQPGPAAERAARLRSVVDRFPDYAAAFNILAYATQLSGDGEGALEVVREYVRLLPRHPNPHDSYAELLQMAGRLDEAERHYRQAVELDPDYREGHVGLAEVAALRGDGPAARRHLEAALARARTPAARWPHLRALGLNAAIAGDFADVRRYMRESAAEAERAGNPDAARYSRWFLAFLEAAEGNAREATGEWAATRAPEDHYTGLGEAYVYAPLGDAARTAAGLKELERTAATNPAVASDALLVARVMDAAVRGDLAAVRTHTAAIEAPSYRVIANAYLARALRAAGDREGEALAIRAIEEYRTIDMAGAYARRLVRTSSPIGR